MKLTLLFLLAVSARFAQQKYKPVQKPVKEDLYYDSGNGVKIKVDDYYDSTNVDTDKELFNLTLCICPLYMFPDLVKGMPRELHPYQWDNSKPVVIYLDSTDLKEFKGVQFFIDTTRTKKAPAIF